MRRLFRRIWFIATQRRQHSELAEEIEFHREMKEREIRATGAPSQDATYAARRALGSMALAQDEARDVWFPVWL